MWSHRERGGHSVVIHAKSIIFRVVRASPPVSGVAITGFGARTTHDALIMNQYTA